MSAAVAAVLAASLAAAAHAGPAAVKVTLTAPTHAPKIGAKWHYTVRATRAGKPLAGKITAQIVDPIGGVHAVEFGKSTKLITAWPFPGVFADYVIWPPESRGVPLTFRVTVVAGGTRKVIPYKVTPHS